MLCTGQICTSRRRGATAVEFALTMPVFVTLLIAVFDLSWVYMQKAALDSSASIGCRAGALVDPGRGEAKLADVEAAAKAALWDAMERSGMGACEDDTCEVEVEVFGSVPSRSLKCTVRRDYRPLVGLVVGELTLASDQAVRLEWQRE